MVSPRTRAHATTLPGWRGQGGGNAKHTAKRHVDDRSKKEMDADWLMDRQIDIPLYTLLAIVIAHALSGTSSLSLPHLSTHLPHSIQTLLPGWARHLPILAPFATDLPNASHDSKHAQPQGTEQYWATTGYAGPFRSDAVGFGHPLTALHNFTRACLGLSYGVSTKKPADSYASSTYMTDDLRYGHSYFDRYPWNSWVRPSSAETAPAGLFDFMDKKYAKGAKDAIFVLMGILVFTVLRALVIRHVLVPLGRILIAKPKPSGDTLAPRVRAAGASKAHRRIINRFSEQAWIALWGSLSLGLSLYTASREPYWNSELKLWVDYPYEHVSGMTKFYYLLQTAFWVQQVIVINVEARRKDHWQMLSHHVVTILLLLGSYTAHFTPIGNIVLILMDPCDILLSTAKCLRYYGAQTACDACFGLFMVGWIITRHILYNRMLYSCIGVARYVLPERPGALKSDYWGFRTFTAFGLVALLCLLQVILCIWLVMIVRVAWRVVSGQGAADTRSDDESDEEEQVQEYGTSKRAQGETRGSSTSVANAVVADCAAASQSSRQRQNALG